MALDLEVSHTEVLLFAYDRALSEWNEEVVQESLEKYQSRAQNYLSLSL